MSIYKVTPELQIRFDVEKTDKGDKSLEGFFLPRVSEGNSLWKITGVVFTRENTDDGWTDWKEYDRFVRLIDSKDPPNKETIKAYLSGASNDYKHVVKSGVSAVVLDLAGVPYHHHYVVSSNNAFDTFSSSSMGQDDGIIDVEIDH